LFSGVFRAEIIDGVGDKRSVGTTFDVQALFGGLFEHVPEICPFC
jgi:hypothetical protein